MNEITYNKITLRIVSVGRIDGEDLVTVSASRKLILCIEDPRPGDMAIWIIEKGRAILIHEIDA